MAFLTIDGTDLACLRSEWVEEEPELQGEETRMEDGGRGSTLRNAKRRWTGPVDFYGNTDYENFRSAISVSGAVGVPEEVSATSDADGLLSGQTVTVTVKIATATRLDFPDDPVTPVVWACRLRVAEV